jgi:hypothetical protein
MSVITINRTIVRPKQITGSKSRYPIRDLTRRFFDQQRNWEFVAEAVLFTILIVISAWPIMAAALAINEFLQLTTI